MASSRSSLTSVSYGSRRTENSPRTSDWQGPRAHGKRSKALFLKEDEKPRIGLIGFKEEVTPPEKDLQVSESATVLRRDSTSEQVRVGDNAKEQAFQKTVTTFITSIDMLLKKNTDVKQPTPTKPIRESIDRYSTTGTSLQTASPLREFSKTVTSASSPPNDVGWRKVLQQFDVQFQSPPTHLPATASNYDSQHQRSEVEHSHHQHQQQEQRRQFQLPTTHLPTTASACDSQQRVEPSQQHHSGEEQLRVDNERRMQMQLLAEQEVIRQKEQHHYDDPSLQQESNHWKLLQNQHHLNESVLLEQEQRAEAERSMQRQLLAEQEVILQRQKEQRQLNEAALQKQRAEAERSRQKHAEAAALLQQQQRAEAESLRQGQQLLEEEAAKQKEDEQRRYEAALIQQKQEAIQKKRQEQHLEHLQQQQKRQWLLEEKEHLIEKQEQDLARERQQFEDARVRHQSEIELINSPVRNHRQLTVDVGGVSSTDVFHIRELKQISPPPEPIDLSASVVQLSLQEKKAFISEPPTTTSEFSAGHSQPSPSAEVTNYSPIRSHVSLVSSPVPPVREMSDVLKYRVSDTKRGAITVSQEAMQVETSQQQQVHVWENFLKSDPQTTVSPAKAVPRVSMVPPPLDLDPTRHSKIKQDRPTSPMRIPTAAVATSPQIFEGQDVSTSPIGSSHIRDTSTSPLSVRCVEIATSPPVFEYNERDINTSPMSVTGQDITTSPMRIFTSQYATAVDACTSPVEFAVSISTRQCGDDEYVEVIEPVVRPNESHFQNLLTVKDTSLRILLQVSSVKLLLKYFNKWCTKRYRSRIALSLAAVNNKAILLRYYCLLKSLQIPDVTTPVLINPPVPAFVVQPNVRNMMERNATFHLRQRFFAKLRCFSIVQQTTRCLVGSTRVVQTRFSELQHRCNTTHIMSVFFSRWKFAIRTRTSEEKIGIVKIKMSSQMLATQCTQFRYKFYTKLLLYARRCIHQRYLNQRCEILWQHQNKLKLLGCYSDLKGYKQISKTKRLLRHQQIHFGDLSCRQVRHFLLRVYFMKLLSYRVFQSDKLKIEKSEDTMTKMASSYRNASKKILRTLRRTSDMSKIKQIFQAWKYQTSASLRSEMHAEETFKRKYYSTWVLYLQIRKKKGIDRELNWMRDNASLLMKKDLSVIMLKKYFGKIKEFGVVKQLLRTSSVLVAVLQKEVIARYYFMMVKKYSRSKKATALMLKNKYHQLLRFTVEKQNLTRLAQRCHINNNIILVEKRLQVWFAFSMNAKRLRTLSYQTAKMHGLRIESCLQQNYNKLVAHREQSIQIRRELAGKIANLEISSLRRMLAAYFRKFEIIIGRRHRLQLIRKIQILENWKRAVSDRKFAVKKIDRLCERSFIRRLALKYHLWVRFYRKRRRTAANLVLKNRVYDVVVARYNKYLRTKSFSALQKNCLIRTKLRKLLPESDHRILIVYWWKWFVSYRGCVHLGQLSLLKKTLSATNNYYDDCLQSQQDQLTESNSLLLMCRSYWKLRNNVPLRRILRATPALIDMTTPGKSIRRHGMTPGRSQA